ncbi:piwi domain-containing protein [Ditylenchus destructor]|nr:piwi domain-containing protein [Ditylenchus destructor]
MIMADTLFIGLGISHPGAMGNYERARGKTPDVPSVIGYAANMKKDPFDFVGDYVFDEPRRDEKFSTVSTIIIYRNGTSEGQFGMSLQYEVPLIKYSLETLLQIPECKVTILVSQKAHNIRLFRHDMPQNTVITLPNGREKKINVNIKPGTVVDTQLTHPMQSEFYLNSHLAIQGTARTPRYTVLLDDSKFSLDDIEGFTYALSYAHQIINSPTSLPSPAYIALLYAKRGRAVHTEARRAGFQDETTDDGALDYQRISNRLAYCETSLADQRVNA